jgi:hypothetical protein
MVIFNSYVSLPEGNDEFSMASGPGESALVVNELLSVWSSEKPTLDVDRLSGKPMDFHSHVPW